MKSILMSGNIDRANEFVAQLEKYINTLKVAKSAMHGVGIKNVTREMLIKAVSGDFGPFNQACAQLISVDLQGVTNPTLRANSQQLFNKNINSIQESIKNMAGSVGSYKYGDAYLDQFFEWGENEVPFVPENAKTRVFEMFSTFVRRDREQLYKKHHQASEALNSLLQELEEAKMTKGMTISPMLFLFQLFTLEQTETGFKLGPKPIDYNYQEEPEFEEVAADLEEE